MDAFEGALQRIYRLSFLLLSGGLASVACTTPPESEVIGGLPCDSHGQCATGFACVQNKCVQPGSASAGGAGETGGALGDASSTGGATGTGGGSGGSGGVGSGGRDASAGLDAADASGQDASADSQGAGGVSSTGGATGNGGADSAGVPGVGVLCGSTSCVPGDQCCYAAASSTYTCQSTTCASGNADVQCDGPEDCPSGDKCCYSATANLYSCKATCGFGDVPIGCSGPQNCGAGDVCCESVSFSGATDTVCATACTLAQYVMCGSDADCPGTTCITSTYLPGLRRCN